MPLGVAAFRSGGMNRPTSCDLSYDRPLPGKPTGQNVLKRHPARPRHSELCACCSANAGINCLSSLEFRQISEGRVMGARPCLQPWLRLRGMHRMLR